MPVKLYTATLIGLDCKVVEVEVDYRKGNTYFSIVGLADKSVQEAKDRIPPAIRNSGFSFVPMQIIINLAPAELTKTGTFYDLPIALGYLIASDQVNLDTNNKIFVGELSLDGQLRQIHGILPLTDAVKKMGYKEIYLPADNANEASFVDGIDIYPVQNLKQLVDHFKENINIHKYKIQNFENINKKEVSNNFDFAMVKGQYQAKRALEIAAAGGHNVLMSGVPGAGKTMLSKCFAGILPEMTLEESLEVTRIYSISGLTSKIQPIITKRPFRSPHHTSSQVALVGGGSIPKPGEISLAHRGVLFLDEFPEFSSQALEALRQPLEDKIVTISRANGTITFPANFILVAAMNPCKCGFKGDPVKKCICSPSDIIRYQKRISGPILDRIDLMINIQKVAPSKLVDTNLSESSVEIKKRVQIARNVQIDRFKDIGIFCNGDMMQNHVEKFVILKPESKKLITAAVDKMNLSARSYYRILKVSRTIADLSGSEEVEEKHLVEALSYRIEI